MASVTTAGAGVSPAEPATVEGDTTDRARRWSRWWQAAVLAVPSVILAERAWNRRWLADDGFINLRITRNLLDGHGPVFNPGERVEVATSTLWVYLVAVADIVLPRRLEQISVVLGMALAVSGLALATFGAARFHRARGSTGLLLPLGALVIAVLPPFWDFSTSGLEGGLTFGWLGLVSWLLADWARSDRRFGGGAAVVVGLGPLVRPDLALAIPVVLAGVLAVQWQGDRRRDRVRLVGQALAVPVLYQVFRMGYYASLVPNTALAKSGDGSRWADGWWYLRDFADPYLLYLPLACLVAIGAALVWRAVRAADRRGLVFLTALPLVGVIDGLYVVRVGGDYMHARLLLPAVFALLAPLCAVPVTWRSAADAATAARTGERAAPASAGAARLAGVGALAVAPIIVAAWAAVAGTQLRWREPPVDRFLSDARATNEVFMPDHALTAPARGWTDTRIRMTLAGEIEPSMTGGSVLDAVPPGGHGQVVFATYAIGTSGYALGDDAYVVDMLGLADPLGARFELEDPGAIGHEKNLPRAWLSARTREGAIPSVFSDGTALSAPLHVSEPGRLDEDAEAARRALDCGSLADLSDAVHDDMTPGRFLRNLWDAPRLTRLEVPPDPHEAEARFCG